MKLKIHELNIFKANKYVSKKLLLLLTMIIILSCCNKNDDSQPVNPIDQLPPATQTGANTFGCLLDGEVFLPGNGPNTLDCVYQFVNGGYYFALQGNKENQDFNIVLIGLSTNDLEIQQNQTYALASNIPANAYGTYALAGIFSTTDSTYTGELTITTLNFNNNIVSGTFWYDVEDTNGVIHQIREGRFDMIFTQ